MKYYVAVLVSIGLFSSLAFAQTPNAPTSTTTTVTTTTPSTQGTPTMSLADQNLKAGQAFLEANKTQPGVTTLADGLQYKVLEQGSGPKPTKSDMVTVDYEGKLINGQVFDSSYQRGQPITFPLSAVIPGWQEALQLMNAGATYELFIPAQLAYGERGAPGAIGPNEALVFKVHLIAVKKAGS
jgi:FKBP-type peptidyl-prolyl cis-trans isomerase FklB